MKREVSLLVGLLGVFLFFNICLLLKFQTLKSKADTSKTVSGQDIPGDQFVDYTEQINFNVNNVNLYRKNKPDPVELLNVIFVNKLIIYINEVNCPPCQENALMRVQESFNQDLTIIIIGYNNKAWLNSRLEKLSNWQNVYYFKGDLGLSINTFGSPVYFIINEDTTCSNPFIPNDDNFDLSSVYFRNLQKQFSKTR